MARLRRFVCRVLALLRVNRVEDDLDREVLAHLALIEDELVRNGMSRADARLAPAGRSCAEFLAHLLSPLFTSCYGVLSDRQRPLTLAPIASSIP